eukprot:Skav232434  [mRNA]  locus=scaffold189:204525:208032:- [translate_table: standard]
MEGMSDELISRVLQINGEAVARALEHRVQDGVLQKLLRDPVELCCPISLQLMEDPVIAADGHTYERASIHNDHAADGLIQTITAMKERCHFLERSCQDRTVMSFVWDLSGYDFSRFRKGEQQISDMLPLGCWGINAWISLYPLGEAGSLPGKASLHLHFQHAVYVRGKITGGNQADTDFSLDRQSEWVRRNFMDTAEILLQRGAQITLQILSIDLPELQLRCAQRRQPRIV